MMHSAATGEDERMRQLRNIVAMCALVAATTLTLTACGSEAPNSTDVAPVTSAASSPSAVVPLMQVAAPGRTVQQSRLPRS
ncbi:hypothetical protein [Rhodococcoides fascians]|uniref:hypothetical protein n=1 Tax=Rhodococcoides fascians TaxID=1828 RepID=UPI000A5286BD|nr:hypothetical protein [Rhodococcus fascians]